MSSRLTLFKSVGSGKYESRCPLCLDSTKNPRKTSFEFFPSKRGGYMCHCHRCGASIAFKTFLKVHHPDIFSSYTYDRFIEEKEDKANAIKGDSILDYKKPKRETKQGILSGVKRISQLPAGHMAREYVVGRQLPTTAHAKLYFAENFSKWINGLIPEKFEKPPKLDPRLVIPLIDRKGDVFAVQGRALAKQEPRYITIRFDDEMPKIFGLESVDPNKRVYVVEGPIDSLFIPNAVAMTGSSCSVERLQEIVGCDKDRLVFLMDNQPRHKEVCKRIEYLLGEGYKVSLWPHTIKEKDINDAVLAGVSNIQKIIDDNIVSGLSGQLKFSKWRKD